MCITIITIQIVIHDLVYLLGEDGLVEDCLKGLDDLVGYGMVTRQPGHQVSHLLNQISITHIYFFCPARKKWANPQKYLKN
jgi:hypothetical protein